MECLDDSRSSRRLVAFVALIAAACSLGDGDATGERTIVAFEPHGPTGDPRDSYVYANFAAAVAILDAAIEAHGGREWVAGDVDFRARLDGRFFLQGHYERPWTHREYELSGTLIQRARPRTLKWDGTLERDRPLATFALLGSEAGAHLTAGASRPVWTEGSALEERWRDELELMPHEYLRQASRHIESLRSLGAAGSNDVIEYRIDDGAEVALFIDRREHLLRRAESIAYWPTKGDRLEWTEFSRYEDVGGVQVAHAVHRHEEHVATQSDVTVTLSGVEVGSPVAAEELTLPEPFRDAFDGDDPAEVVASAPDPLPVHALGGGVFLIDLPSIDARSLLVEFDDFCVVAEGGDRSEVSERILETADALAPGKPVRYLAMSHHHPLYAGGMRSYVHRGATILTTAGNVEYLRDLATRPHALRPDAQERAPVDPLFEVVSGVRVIDDGTQRLELHEFATSTHVDEFVLIFVPGAKLGFAGDLIHRLAADPVRPAGSRARAVHRLIEERGLEIERFSQPWFLEQGLRLFPFSDLEESVRLAEAREAEAHAAESHEAGAR